MGFDVDFPAVREAAERMRSADAATRAIGVEANRHLEAAASAAGGGELASALDGVTTTMQQGADRAANVLEELWQAIDTAEQQYYAGDAAASRDIGRVRFGGHDGSR